MASSGAQHPQICPAALLQDTSALRHTGIHGCAAERSDRHASAALSTNSSSDEGRLSDYLRRPAGIWPTWSLGPGLTHSSTAWPPAALSSHPSLSSQNGSHAGSSPTSTTWTWGRGKASLAQLAHQAADMEHSKCSKQPWAVLLSALQDCGLEVVRHNEGQHAC